MGWDLSRNRPAQPFSLRFPDDNDEELVRQRLEKEGVVIVDPNISPPGSNRPSFGGGGDGEDSCKGISEELDHIFQGFHHAWFRRTVHLSWHDNFTTRQGETLDGEGIEEEKHPLRPGAPIAR